MEVRQLRYFLQICESGSLLKAADSLYISHQALSKSLAALETELGAPLFFRTSRGVVLTQLGGALKEQARVVVDEMDRLTSGITELVLEGSGMIRLGLAESLLHFSSEKIWDDFCESHPKNKIEVNEYEYGEIVELIKAGRLDAGIVSDWKRTEDFESFDFPVSERLVLIGKDNPLYDKESLEIADLKNESFVLCINEFAYQRFVELCEMSGFTPRVRRVKDTLYMYETCNKNGLSGLSIAGLTDDPLPRYKNLRAIPFRDKVFPYSLSLIWRKNSSRKRSIRELADYLALALS